MLLDEDRIVREIRRIAELVGRALQLRSLESRDEAEDALGALHRGVFGMDRDLTLKVAPESLAMLLMPSQREAAVTLLESEIAFLEGHGEQGAADVRRAQLEAVLRI
jgi:hypothetical protein